MAGHSKWAQIKRSKAVVDSKRGALFTRLSREIIVAARAGSDPTGNFQLRTAIEKAKAASMPAVNIERAIAKGAGQAGDASIGFDQVRYEGYGPGGIPIVVETLTDNRNRTAADIRLAFNKHKGNLGDTGCVAYLFNHYSEVYIRAKRQDIFFPEELLLGKVVDLDVIGYEIDGENAMVYGPFNALESIHNGLIDDAWCIVKFGHRWVSKIPLKLSKDSGDMMLCLKLIGALEMLDDVINVSSALEW